MQKYEILEEMHQEHDKGYKTLLAHPEVFVELLKSFVNEPWTDRIDPKDLEQMHTGFILPTFERREADIIYKLKDATGNTVYFYCLMELQSSVDYSILIRLLFYMAVFWMELLKGIPPDELNRRDFRLPMIIPVVLYNGEDSWWVSREFASVYPGDIEPFREYLVNFKYHLIDVNRYSREELIEIGNLMAAVFLVDQKGAPVKTMAYVKELVEKFEAIPRILKNLNRVEGSVFLQWMKGIIYERMPREGGGFKGIMEDLLKRLEEETEADMFVSNFAVGYSAFIEQYDEDMRALRLAKEENVRVEQEKARAEREKVRVEQEKAHAEREKARMEQEKTRIEQEKAQVEQSLMQAVMALQEAGLSVEAISQKIGRSREEIETMF